MYISASNTGKSLTFYIDSEAYNFLNRVIQPSQPGRFGFSYSDGFITIGNAGEGDVDRKFIQPESGATDKWLTTITTPGFVRKVPAFGKERYRGFVQQEGTCVLPLPAELKPAKPHRPRTLTLRNRVATTPKHRGTWKSEEARQRSLAGLVKARAVRQAQVRARRSATQPTATIQPEPNYNPTGMANLILQVGSKTVNYKVPEDELYEYAFELSEKGYRLK